MALINSPPNTPVDVIEPHQTMVQENGQLKTKTSYVLKISQSWLNLFNQMFRICSGVTQSGATAQRPTSELWVGRPYFDTTLGYQINYDGTNWVDGSGNTV
jgi:hypothetical protein